MAEVTGLRNNALPYPVYGVPYGVTFPILDADGDLVTGATGLDSERSLNGDTFADCTNEATEIATTSGMYYLLLTAAEMTADVVSIIVKTTSSGAKTTVITLYPRKLVALRSGTAQGGAAGYITLDASAGSRDDRWNGCLCVATIDTLVEARIINDYTGSNQQAAVTPNWNVTPDSDDTFVLYVPEGMQNPTVNVSHINEQSQTARDIGESVLLSAGTGTGQLDFTSGVVKSNVTQNAGTNINATGGRQEVNVSHFGGAAGVFTIAGLPDVNVSHYNGTDASTAIVPADIQTIKTQAVTCAAGVTIGVYVGGTGAAALEATAQSILTDTAEIGAAGAGLTALASASNLAVVANYLDTEIAEILTKIGTPSVTLADDIAAISGGGLDAAGVRAAIGLASANLDTQLGNTHSRIGAPIGASISADIAAVKTDTGNTYTIVNSGTFGNAAIKTAVDSLAPASDVSTAFTQTYGSVISGTYANTATDDNSRHVLAPHGTNALDANYTFTIPTDNKPTRVTINGYFNGTAQYAEAYAYNYDTAAYVQLSNSTTRMNTRSSDANYSYELSRDNVDASTGEVKIRFTSPSTNTAHRLHLDRILVYSLTEAGTEAGLTSENVWEYEKRQLTSDGLDLISTTAPTGVAANFREMLVQVWRRFFKRTVYNNAANTINTYADDGTTIVTTQTATSAAGVETQGPAT